MSLSNDNTKKFVREYYSNIAKSNSSGCGCCGGTEASNSISVNEISKDLGYSDEDLVSAPKDSNMGLGCGNPLAIASLKPGEVVLDLGSGGGFDCFLARERIGNEGYIIGVDMTPDMISLARKNAENTGYKNVDFRLGEIENLPVANETIDVIISNCVINLSPDKERVFREAYRVLKKGGRLSISDVVANVELPSQIKEDLQFYAGCVSGAETIEHIKELLVKAGFENVKITSKDNNKEIVGKWVPGKNVEDYITSAIIQADKK